MSGFALDDWDIFAAILTLDNFVNQTVCRIKQNNNNAFFRHFWVKDTFFSVRFPYNTMYFRQMEIVVGEPILRITSSFWSIPGKTSFIWYLQKITSRYELWEQPANRERDKTKEKRNRMLRLHKRFLDRNSQKPWQVEL